MEVERLPVVLGESPAGGKPDAAFRIFRNGHDIVGSESVTPGEALDQAVRADPIHAEVSGDPDVATAVFVNGADGVVRQTVRRGECGGLSSGDPVHAFRGAEPESVVTGLRDGEYPGQARVVD